MSNKLRGFAIDLAKDAMDGKLQKGNMGDRAYDVTVGTGMAVGKKAATTQLKIWENLPRLVVRGLQFIFGLVIIGFYGHRVAANAGPAWTFGLFVAAVSAVTAVTFAVLAPFGAVHDRLKTHRFFFVDYGLFLFWIIVFGIFAGIFLKRADDDEFQGASPSVQRKVVWVDLVNALLWLISGTYGLTKKLLGKQIGKLERKLKGTVMKKTSEPWDSASETEIYPTRPAKVHKNWKGDEMA
jgi:hypothetical protein